MTAFKALKRKEREAVLLKLVADEELADDLADPLALEARRHQPQTPLRDVLKDLRIRARAGASSLGRDAKKEWARLPAAMQKRLARVLLSLEDEPFPAGCKKHKNRDGWRVRVGDYRILPFADKGRAKFLWESSRTGVTSPAPAFVETDF